nr:MFS transporter [Anaerolineae bacterium]
LNPFIGYLADRVNPRFFVILAPAITATLMTLIGIMPGYGSLAILLFVAGISVAVFHAPAPAMIAPISGNKVGRGMSIFMAGGELGRTVGPILAVWGISLFSLQGLWRLSAIGWLTTLILFFRLRGGAAKPTASTGLHDMLSSGGRLFVPLTLIALFRSLLQTSLSVYLPTYMDQKGASLWLAGGSLAVLELAGVVGALLSGSISDRVGRKPVLLVAFLGAALSMYIFLHSEGWLIFLVLIMLGLSILSTQPVLLAVVQEQFIQNRSAANGLYMSISFIARMIATLIVGVLGDSVGLNTAFGISALVVLLAIPPVLWLPAKQPGVRSI